MQVFKSKVDWWLGLPLIYPIFLSITSIVVDEWYGYMGLFIIILLIIIASKVTKYIISENQLTIQCFFYVNAKINILKIKTIEKTNSIVSSPALSFDRIRINYNKYDEIFISPKEKQHFINQLLEINPKIQVSI